MSTNSTTGAKNLIKQSVDRNSRNTWKMRKTRLKIGVDEGDRTLDRRSHNPELYQLSYAHHIGIYLSAHSTKLRFNVTDCGLDQAGDNNGAPGRTRTCDPRLRRPMLYPAELRALDRSPG